MQVSDNNFKYAIRQGTLDDLHDLVVATSHAHKDSPYRNLDGELDIADSIEFISSLLAGDQSVGCVFIATHDNSLVGLIMCTMMPYNRSLHDKVVAGEPLWWVHPDHRGGTLGLRLLKQYETWATDSGYHLVQTGALDDRTGKLLERLGYTEIGRTYMKELSNGS
jgi:GNAT superfamily N-acetyltransferase